jgi:hypothetical protein
MAEKRTINIDINNNADEAAKDFENFAKATNIANDSVEGLNKTFEEVYGELQPLTTRMGEAEDRLYELAAAGDTTSREYQELLTKVGEYRKVQIQTDLAVDQAAKTLSQKLGTALTGAASGFTAATGVIGLMGTESQELEKLLLKVNAAMAFQQGIEGIREYTKSVGLASKVTKVFNLIIAANPLAIFLTIITSIVASVLLFTDVLDQAIQKLKNLGDAIGLTNFAENELAEERRKRNVAQMERQKAEQTLRDAEIRQLEALGKSTIALRRQQVVANIAAIKQQKEFNDLFAEGENAIRRALGQEEIKAKQSEASIRRQAQIVDLETQLIELDKEQEALNKANSDKQKERRKKKKEDLEEINRLRQEAIDKEIDEEIALQQTFDAIQRENEDRFRTEQENELLLVEEKYDALEAMAFGNAEALNEIEIAKMNELNDIQLKYQQEEIEIEELGYRKKLELASASFTAIADLVGSFNTQNEKDAERQFKIQKAFNLAAAVTNTALAVTGALTAGGNPIKLATGAQFVEAGIAAAVGAANIVKIAQSQFGQGDTGGTQDISAPSVQAPQFNVVGDSGVNQLAQLQQQPTQAYVVSGEVTTAQALDRNRVQNATL